MLRKLLTLTLTIILITPQLVHASTQVMEGGEAKAAYEEQKSTAHTLKQKDKIFVLVTPDGTETPKAEEMTVSVGEYFFITNEEDKVVHNVYDETDHSWVLKKQKPSGVAAIAFSEPGVHKLRCAIHPKMRITVNVVE